MNVAVKSHLKKLYEALYSDVEELHNRSRTRFTGYSAVHIVYALDYCGLVVMYCNQCYRNEFLSVSYMHSYINSLAING